MGEEGYRMARERFDERVVFEKVINFLYPIQRLPNWCTLPQTVDAQRAAPNFRK